MRHDCLRSQRTALAWPDSLKQQHGVDVAFRTKINREHMAALLAQIDPALAP